MLHFKLVAKKIHRLLFSCTIYTSFIACETLPTCMKEESEMSVQRCRHFDANTIATDIKLTLIKLMKYIIVLKLPREWKDDPLITA